MSLYSGGRGVCDLLHCDSSFCSQEETPCHIDSKSPFVNPWMLAAIRHLVVVVLNFTYNLFTVVHKMALFWVGGGIMRFFTERIL